MKKIPVLILFFITALSHGQTDMTRFFPSERVNWDLHGAIASVVDSTNLKEYSKIDFIGMHNSLLFGRLHGTMSFSFVNDSVLQLKEHWSSDPENQIDSCFLLRKTGSYIESDSVGNTTSLEFIKTNRDSAGYKIINYETNMTAKRPLSWGLYIRLYDPKRRLLAKTDVHQHGQTTYKYEYKDDTTFIKKYDGSRKDGEYRIITKKIVKKRKVITRSIIVGREYNYPGQMPSQPQHGVNTEIKIYNKQNELVEVKLKRTGRIDDEIILTNGGRMKIKYYKKLP